jgi:hypothetical protein
MKNDTLSEADFPLFVAFISALPEPDEELNELGKKAHRVPAQVLPPVEDKDNNG